MTNIRKVKILLVQKSLIFFYNKINKGIIFDYYLNFLKVLKLFQAKLTANNKKINDFHNPFYLSRKSRFYMYSNGLNFRLEFLFNEYLLGQIKFDQNDFVIDCGANIGELGFYLNHKHNIKNVISVEPERIEFETLKLNSFYSKFKPLNYALHHFIGEVNFYSNNETADSSIFPNNNLKSKKIKTITLDKIFNDYKIQECKLLKLEAEGAEPEILNGGLKNLEKIHFISVDCGPERGEKNENTIAAVSKLILKYDFSLADAGGIRKILLFKNNKF